MHSIQQIFHMCDEEGNRIPHLCANETSFNQEYRICDWDYNFNCTESPVSYEIPRFLGTYTYELSHTLEMVLPERTDLCHRSARWRWRGLLNDLHLIKYLLCVSKSKQTN